MQKQLYIIIENHLIPINITQPRSHQIAKPNKGKMSSDLQSSKPHAVCVPFPAQGHVTPMMRLAKILHSRGFHITFVNTEFNHNRLIRSKGLDSVKGFPDFRFESIPDGLPPSERNATQDIPTLSYSTRENCLGPFKKLLSRLNSPEEEVPVTVVVSDGLAGFGRKGAKEMGIKHVHLWTASVCALMSCLYFELLVKRGIVPFQEENLANGTMEKYIDWIPSMKHLRYKDFPSFIQITDLNDIMFNFLSNETRESLDSNAMIFNTFDGLEHDMLEALVVDFNYTNAYAIGPLALLEHQVSKNHLSSLDPSLWKPDSKVLEWLDEKEPNSVLYVNYGSITVMSDEHFQEFAWGLANSKHPFVWIIRPDVTMGETIIFPDGFLEEIKDRGFVTSWCPQDQVLEHASVRVYLTHCGWNSTTESISAGVPVICWPFFADQQMNCRFLCNEWGMGKEIESDVKRNQVETLVKEMMGESGEGMRKKANEWKAKAIEATNVGGSSYNAFDRLVNEVLQ